MRLYSFTNSYLSSLQHGLQTAHMIAELYQKYPQGYNSKSLALYEWGDKHKTIIIKNGGNHEGLFGITTHFVDERNSYPWTVFREDRESLNNTITAVGIVVPDKFYSVGWGTQTFTPWELDLLSLIQKAPLAV